MLRQSFGQNLFCYSSMSSTCMVTTVVRFAGSLGRKLGCLHYISSLGNRVREVSSKQVIVGVCKLCQHGDHAMVSDDGQVLLIMGNLGNGCTHTGQYLEESSITHTNTLLPSTTSAFYHRMGIPNYRWISAGQQ